MRGFQFDRLDDPSIHGVVLPSFPLTPGSPLPFRRPLWVLLGWGGGSIEKDIRQMYHSSQIADGADNFMSYSNPELDKLIDEARVTMDEKTRMKLWQKCHAILYEDQPYTYMFNSQSLRFIDKRIANIQKVTQGLNDRIEWFVPTDLQRWTK